MDDDFDWNKLNEEDIIVRPARETAVYLNSDGDVVIRQRKEWPDEQDDPYMVIPMDRVPAFLNRVRQLIEFSQKVQNEP